MRTAMGDIFNELLCTYFTQSHLYLNEVNDAFGKKDFQTLERIFHSLGSSSSSIGAERLSKLARRLEKKSTEEAGQIAINEINALKDEYIRVEKVLKTFVDQETGE
ncbi:MAG: Hpt domain-containing protein [Gammaproteobacteria bacterium]|nr:Hpt domain-containing protein [Gammaproteobacteria bacterium]MCW8909896.1 Hpt domain-containing protein [Gammaproteobacteria bacterium]